MTRNDTNNEATATAEARGQKEFGGELARAAVIIAMRGASEYLRVHKLNVDPESLRACVKDRCKVKFDEAMTDAKEALDINMTDAMVATFTTSMILAGIEGAKEASDPLKSMIRRAQAEANKAGVNMVVIDDGLAERDSERYQYCPAAGRDMLFGDRERQQTVAILSPEKSDGEVEIAYRAVGNPFRRKTFKNQAAMEKWLDEMGDAIAEVRYEEGR